MTKAKKTKKKEIYLNIAGFNIKISLLPTELVYLKQVIEEQIERVWLEGGFGTKKKNKVDFEIIVNDFEGTLQIVPKEKNKKHFYLTFERDFKERKIKSPYFVSIAALNRALKEIIVYLLSGEGFLLHASAVMDKKGEFYIFMAKSGGGKSTLANILSEDESFDKVADDTLIVRKIDKEWVYYSSPLIEKDELPGYAWTKKAKIFFVKKGKKAKAKKTTKDMLKILLEQLWLMYDKVEEDTLKTAVAFSEDNEFFELTSNLKRKDIIEKIK